MRPNCPNSLRRWSSVVRTPTLPTCRQRETVGRGTSQFSAASPSQVSSEATSDTMSFFGMRVTCVRGNQWDDFEQLGKGFQQVQQAQVALADERQQAVAEGVAHAVGQLHRLQRAARRRLQLRAHERQHVPQRVACGLCGAACALQGLQGLSRRLHGLNGLNG